MVWTCIDTIKVFFKSFAEFCSVLSSANWITLWCVLFVCVVVEMKFWSWLMLARPPNGQETNWIPPNLFHIKIYFTFPPWIPLLSVAILGDLDLHRFWQTHFTTSHSLKHKYQLKIQKDKKIQHLFWHVYFTSRWLTLPYIRTGTIVNTENWNRDGRNSAISAGHCGNPPPSSYSWPDSSFHRPYCSAAWSPT